MMKLLKINRIVNERCESTLFDFQKMERYESTFLDSQALGTKNLNLRLLISNRWGNIKDVNLRVSISKRWRRKTWIYIFRFPSAGDKGRESRFFVSQPLGTEDERIYVF